MLKKHNQALRLLTLFLLFCNPLFAQQKGLLRGSIENNAGEKIPNASIVLNNSHHGQHADNEGNFHLKNLHIGSHSLKVSAIGYRTITQKVTVNNQSEPAVIRIRLEALDNKLDEVNVSGKTETQKAAQQAYQVSVIDAKKLHNTTLNIASALNTVPGIRVRESGGLGSSTEFSLNGFSGNQVKFFIDGIPMENMGNAFRINNIPINLAERIEVYKGVVPVNLGADALGGAINIVTNSGKTSYLDASYSYGSFNTHKTSVNLAMNNKKGFTFMLNALQNYSDNNYWIEFETEYDASGQLYPVRTRRFHDRYRNEMVMLAAGVRHKAWADQFLVGIDLGEYKKDIQNGNTMEDVFGKRETKGITILPSIKYLKRNLGLKNLDLNISGNFNFGYDRTIDTAAARYNWLGTNILPSSSTKRGERSLTDSRYHNNDGVFTANLSYKLDDKHSFVLNNNYTTLRRVSKNLLGDNDTFFDNKPGSVRKNVLGLSYRYDYSKKWNTIVFAKLYQQNSRAFVDTTASVDPVPSHNAYAWQSSKFTTQGYGVASTYFFRDDLQLRASYEHGIRVPTSNELLGNMNTMSGNFTLKPEKSENVNLGVIYSPSINNTHFLTFDAAVLYRYSRDFIRPRMQRVQASTGLQMVNLRDVDNKGVELSIRYRYKNIFNIGSNISYQNLINQTKYEGGTDDMVSIVYKDRIPNMPYFFGNTDAYYSFNNFMGTDGSLTLGYQLYYTHEYFESWPSLGTKSKKVTIPTQWNHNVNLIYAFKGGKYNVTLECLNMTDALLYDHFKLQKPSRSFNVKFRYFLFNM